jgi:hypothetical protein
MEFGYKPITCLAQIFLQTTTKLSKPKQTNKHAKKKNDRKRECDLLQEIIQIATLQAMAQLQSPNNSSKNCCELANK